MIVIGLGTGRSGTASLARIIGAQQDAFCFHEMNPACIQFAGTPRPILNTIDEFQAIIDGGDPSMLTVDLAIPYGRTFYERLCKMERVRLIGDVAFYYLSYIEAIAARNPNVRFLCLRRDIDETVESWMKKTEIARGNTRYVVDRVAALILREPFLESQNFWMEHDGTRWVHDPRWDKLFPKYEARSKEDAIRQYCKFYYEEADRLAARLPRIFRYVEMDSLNDRITQSAVLEFVGIPTSEQVFVSAHNNKSRSAKKGGGE